MGCTLQKKRLLPREEKMIKVLLCVLLLLSCSISLAQYPRNYRDQTSFRDTQLMFRQPLYQSTMPSDTVIIIQPYRPIRVIRLKFADPALMSILFGGSVIWGDEGRNVGSSNSSNGSYGSSGNNSRGGSRGNNSNSSNGGSSNSRRGSRN